MSELSPSAKKLVYRESDFDRPLRVLHLPLDIRWIQKNTIRAQEALGIECKTYFITKTGLDNPDELRLDLPPVRESWRKLKGYPRHLINLYKFYKHFRELVEWADVIHWQYAARLFPNQRFMKNFDLWLPLWMRKPVIAQLHGGETRIFKNYAEFNPYWAEAYTPELAEALDARARETHENFLKKDFLFAMGHGMFFCLDEEERRSNVELLERMMDVSALEAHFKEDATEPVVIVHAPSNPEGKGSQYIIPAMEELVAEFEAQGADSPKLEFVQLIGVSHDEVLSELKRADIVVDQLFAGDYGLFAVEAMASGAAVVNYMHPEITASYPDDMPVVSATKENLKEVVRELVLNPKKRISAAKAGPSYAMRIHSIETVTPELLRLYRKAAVQKGQVETAQRIAHYHRLSMQEGWFDGAH